ncbi:MAG: MFS transporter, partial [Dokdonella sp.]
MSSAAGGDPASEPLRHHPAFFQFWFSRITASFAFQMLSVAVAWQIYEITNNPLHLGLIGLIQFIPSLLLALPAGHFADQFERRRIALTCQIIEGIAIAVLAGGTLFGVLSEGLILGIVFVIGVAKAFEWPAMQSMVPALVPPAILPRAMAVNASAGQAATIAGPALGGFL